MLVPLRTDKPKLDTPYVNYSLIGVNVLVFLLELSKHPDKLHSFFFSYGLVPQLVTQAFAHKTMATLPAAVLPFFTCMFLHGGFFHLLGNMWMLYMFGYTVEDLLGHAGYAVFYIGSGLAASLAFYAVNVNSAIPMIGASGAIAGVMGAYFIRFPKAKIDVFVLSIGSLLRGRTHYTVSAWYMLGLWFLAQVINSSFARAAGATGGIAWAAHIGGFLVGLVIAFLGPPTPVFDYNAPPVIDPGNCLKCGNPEIFHDNLCYTCFYTRTNTSSSALPVGRRA
jgi:membrane associated rhomboid family serine protease